jgi:hypothetical protein
MDIAFIADPLREIQFEKQMFAVNPADEPVRRGR